MHIYEKTFHRLFSLSMYKTLKLPLGQMTFTKDFVNTIRGDLYPVLSKSENCTETVADNRYSVTGGKITRLIGQFFPYATYAVSFESLAGSIGFVFRTANCEASVLYDGTELLCSTGDSYPLAESLDTLIVSCRPGAFDVYTEINGSAQFLHTFPCEGFQNAHQQSEFSCGTAALALAGNVTIRSAEFYIDCGISQADIRPIRYEDGRVMVENGKIYLTISIRMQEQMFQGVLAWVPGTAKFELTGAVFYDSGDGKWCGDVADDEDRRRSVLRIHRSGHTSHR